MLEKIKSKYIVQKPFFFLKEELKLKIIKYNKKLQNKINISLNHYKIFSGKYISIETENKIKEYNSINDVLIFEGGYLNGQKNGKGREYYYGELIFEGEYKNGKKNGEGKEYYLDKLIFEGEYLNGKKWNGIGYSTMSKKSKIFKVYNKFKIEHIKDKLNYNDLKELKEGKELTKEQMGLIKDVFEDDFINSKVYEIKEGKGLIKEYFDNKLTYYKCHSTS